MKNMNILNNIQHEKNIQPTFLVVLSSFVGIATPSFCLRDVGHGGHAFAPGDDIVGPLQDQLATFGQNRMNLFLLGGLAI